MRIFLHAVGTLHADRLGPGEIAGRVVPMGSLSAATENEVQPIRTQYRAVDRSVLLTIAAARLATSAAGWSSTDGVLIGSSRGATNLLEHSHERFLKHGVVATKTSPLTTLGNLSSLVAQDFGGAEMAIDLSVTCSTALHALHLGSALIRAGEATRMLVGGGEAPLTPFTLAQMETLGIYSGRLDDPYPCRPCVLGETRENTMVLGEGAGVLAISSDPGPFEVLGVGTAMEALTSPTSVSHDGAALKDSMRRAITRAGVSGVDAVILHAPGTARGDRAELSAIKSLNGRPLLYAPKWRFGHTFAAAGALGIEIACALLSHGAEAEPRAPFPQHPDLARSSDRKIRTVMVNGWGFGGNACSVIIGVV